MNFFEPKPIGKETFSIFFTVGSFLFFAYYFSRCNCLIMIGLYFILISIIINSVILFHEFFQALNNLSYSRKYWISCLWITSNIPISIIYLRIILFT